METGGKKVRQSGVMVKSLIDFHTAETEIVIIYDPFSKRNPIRPPLVRSPVNPFYEVETCRAQKELITRGVSLWADTNRSGNRNILRFLKDVFHIGTPCTRCGIRFLWQHCFE